MNPPKNIIDFIEAVDTKQRDAHADTSEVFTVEDQRVLVEHIPAQVCKRCGEATFSRETTEKIRKLIHGGRQPFKTVSLSVFELV